MGETPHDQPEYTFNADEINGFVDAFAHDEYSYRYDGFGDEHQVELFSLEDNLIRNIWMLRDEVRFLRGDEYNLAEKQTQLNELMQMLHDLRTLPEPEPRNFKGDPKDADEAVNDEVLPLLSHLGKLSNLAVPEVAQNPSLSPLENARQREADLKIELDEINGRKKRGESVLPRRVSQVENDLLLIRNRIEQYEATGDTWVCDKPEAREGLQNFPKYESKLHALEVIEGKLRANPNDPELQKIYARMKYELEELCLDLFPELIPKPREE